jgi:hypothetical protein
MMDEEKILKIFKNFAGETLNIRGLIVVPVKVEPSQLKDKRLNIYFKIFNPNNVSYFLPIVEDYIYDETEDFGDYINKKIDIYLVDGTKPIYLNEELISKIQKVFNSVKTIEFVTGTPFIGYQRYVLHIRSVGVSTDDHLANDKFDIINNVKAIRAEKNGESWDPKVVANLYIKEFLSYKESYYETEEYYKQIDTILNEYPLFNDQYGHTVGYYDTNFVG